MPIAAFLGDSARALVAERVRALEVGTSAEVVVAIRTRSALYRDTDYLVGFGAALVTLGALLFLPQRFHIASWPAEVTLGFIAGALVSATLWPVKRRLLSRRRTRSEVRRAAREAFFDLGIGHTRAHTGVLVYVSLGERRLEVVLDAGAEEAARAALWPEARRALQAALAAGDFARFCAALELLHAPLAAALPARPDDENELADEPSEHEHEHEASS